MQTQAAIRYGCDVVVAAGGDGTLFYVMNALRDQANIPLCVLPLGTGNDFAKMIGIHSIEDAASAICEGNIVHVDTLETCFEDLEQQQQQVAFCSTAGVGVFAHLFSQERYWLIRKLRRWFGNIMNPIGTVFSALVVKSHKCQVCFDDYNTSISFKLFEISKVSECGGLGLTPFARLDNEILNAWVIGDTNLWQSIRVFVKALFGKHLTDSMVDYFDTRAHQNRYQICNVKKITMQASGKFSFHLHGEFVGYNPQYFIVSPKKLPVLSHKAI